MKIAAYLKMSRMSNLPTVWSNVLSGMALGRGDFGLTVTILALSSLSFYYVAGMFLNDACDSEIDVRMRPERPIPSGLVGRNEALAIALGLLVVANGLLVAGGVRGETHSFGTLLGFGLALTLSIVLYDYFHKRISYGPLLIALCRFLTYAIAAQMAATAFSPRLWPAALLAAMYIVGLSWAARQEDKTRLPLSWPILLLFAPLVFALPYLNSTLLMPLSFLAWLVYCTSGMLRGKRPIRTYVGFLIAAISLWDALILSCLGFPLLSAIAVACFALTLAVHLWIAGT